VLEVKKDENGGYLTYFEGSKYPLRGFPTEINLHLVDCLKRPVIANIKFVTRPRFSIDGIVRAVAEWMDSIYMAVFREKYQRPDGDYSQSSREILRVLRKLNPFPFEGWIKFIVDIWEGDMAYRTRGQDGLGELDKEKLRKNPRKEILRLFNLVSGRESNIVGGQRPKMDAIRKMLWLALLSRKIVKKIATFLEEIDIEQVRFDINDKYWLANKFDYDFEGKTYEERMEWKREQEKDWIPPKVPPELPRIAINPPNKAFYDLKAEEASEMIVGTAKALRDDWLKHQKA
jgi:hypothetical protein